MDRQRAWELANNLCDAILDLGYEFADAVSHVSVEMFWLTDPLKWQGTIELRLKPVKSDQ